MRPTRRRSLIGCRFNRSIHSAKERRKIMRPERELGQDAQAPTTATFDSPKKIRISARICNPHLPVGGDDFNLQQTSRSDAVVFREASESTALDEASNANSRTPSTLNEAAVTAS